MCILIPVSVDSQADRSRRHLVQAASKKKNKRKSRLGSFSLLSNDKKSNPLQVSLHGNPHAEEQLGRRHRMCRQSYKATSLGFISSIRPIILCSLKFRQCPVSFALENVNHHLFQCSEIS